MESDGRITTLSRSKVMVHFIWFMDEMLFTVINSKERAIRPCLYTSRYSPKGWSPGISLAENSLQLQLVSYGLLWSLSTGANCDTVCRYL